MSREDLTDLVIPEGTTEIGEYAFAGGRFTSVMIPNSVTNVGENAFLGCENLKRVDVASLKDWMKIEFANAAANPLYYGAELHVAGERCVHRIDFDVNLYSSVENHAETQRTRRKEEKTVTLTSHGNLNLKGFIHHFGDCRTLGIVLVGSEISAFSASLREVIASNEKMNCRI